MARILVIDDEPAVRRMLREMLEEVGHEVVTAPEGDAALARFRQSPFDLVITDIFMPGREGISTIAELRREHPDLPILALSGGGRPRPLDLASRMDYLEVARRHGATRVLRKPVDWEELALTVKELLASASTA
jgi:CheY-like chemotaxis protein